MHNNHKPWHKHKWTVNCGAFSHRHTLPSKERSLCDGRAQTRPDLQLTYNWWPVVVVVWSMAFSVSRNGDSRNNGTHGPETADRFSAVARRRTRAHNSHLTFLFCGTPTDRTSEDCGQEMAKSGLALLSTSHGWALSLPSIQLQHSAAGPL